MPSTQTRKHASKRRDSFNGYFSARFAIIAAIFALFLIVGAAMLQSTGITNVRAAGVSAPNVVKGTISPLVAHSHLIGPTDSRQILSLSLSLHPQNEAGLNSYVQDIYRTGSVNFHRYLTPTQFAGIYAPSKTNYDAVTSFIKTAGFAITNTYIQHLLIGFKGTVAQAEQAFHVSINNYRAADGHTYFANAGDPVLPAWSAGVVQSVNGLNDAASYQHASLASKAVVKQSQVTPDSAPGCPVVGAGHLLPSQLASVNAYNLQSLYDAGYQGEGQTVALFELASYVPGDLTAYTNCFGSRKTSVQSIVVGSGPTATDAEVVLDADILLSAAPQLGNLKIYQSAQADALLQWAQIVNDAVPVVSTSWGLCEDLSVPGTVASENTWFTTAAAQGQTIFAASGDTGSEGCYPSSSDTTVQNLLNVDDPASQPFVTSVGGTTLTLGTGSTFGSETVWNTSIEGTSLPGHGAGGGGLSTIWELPSWQTSGGINAGSCTHGTGTAGHCREVPDVSLNADPSNGYEVYCTTPVSLCSSSTPWQVFGGTSAGAPMWAAWMALTNESSVQQGKSNLGFINSLLYTTATAHPTDFHDIPAAPAGDNDYTESNSGNYATLDGYDMATGLGSYNGLVLANALILLATPRATSPASTKWYFAEGSVGGGFQEYLTLFNPSPAAVATVDVAYLFDYRSSVTVKHVIAASARVTVSVNEDLGIQVTDPQQALSTIVTSIGTTPVPIVAERPMYFNYRGINSGTDTLGSTGTSQNYYFPMVDSRQTGRNYYSYITMLNPNATVANVTVTYYTGSCGNTGQATCPTQLVTIQPMMRATVSPLAVPLQQQMSASVVSSTSIVVERPAYISDTLTTAGGLTTGAATTTGSTIAAIGASDWLFAEGYTGTNFQEYLVLANFLTADTTATIKLEYANGTTQSISKPVPALGQAFVDVNAAASTCTSPCIPTTTVSAEVTTVSQPIVAERLMYFHQSSAKISGVTEVVGKVGPATDSNAQTYSFSEGYTTNNFNEYLTLQNPHATINEIMVVTLFVDTYVFQEQVAVNAHTRYTLSINALVAPIVKAHYNLGSNSYDVSLLVQAVLRPTGTGTGVTGDAATPVVIAERPMYFNYHGMQGGTDIIGDTVLPA